MCERVKNTNEHSHVRTANQSRMAHGILQDLFPKKYPEVEMRGRALLRGNPERCPVALFSALKTCEGKVPDANPSSDASSFFTK